MCGQNSGLLPALGGDYSSGTVPDSHRIPFSSGASMETGTFCGSKSRCFFNMFPWKGGKKSETEIFARSDGEERLFVLFFHVPLQF